MTVPEILAAVAVALTVGGAVLYIVREKRRGTRCIGCPHRGSCPSAKGGGCSSGEHAPTDERDAA